jgi:hypothetical protein
MNVMEVGGVPTWVANATMSGAISTPSPNCGMHVKSSVPVQTLLLRSPNVIV